MPQDNTLLISVLIPFYNSENWIQETIESILNQSYTNWEIILVDDGSTDNSIPIVNSYSGYANIKLYTQNNQGASSARNLAFEKSEGQYIQYLDSDDLLSFDKLEKQINLLLASEDPLAISSSSWCKFQDEFDQRNCKKLRIDKSYSNCLQWFVDSWVYGGHGVIHNWLVPRIVVERAGKWNPKIGFNDDGEFFSRVLIQASQIIYAEGPMAYYRMANPNSLSQSHVTKERAESLLLSFEEYNKTLFPFLEMQDIQTALASNFYRFIYHYDTIYPDLVQMAWNSLNLLPKADEGLILKSTFHKLASIIGFNTFLKLRSIKRKFHRIN